MGDVQYPHHKISYFRSSCGFFCQLIYLSDFYLKVNIIFSEILTLFTRSCFWVINVITLAPDIDVEKFIESNTIPLISLSNVIELVLLFSFIFFEVPSWHVPLSLFLCPSHFFFLSALLQLPIREACHVAVQMNHPTKHRLWKHALARQQAKGQGSTPVLEIVRMSLWIDSIFFSKVFSFIEVGWLFFFFGIRKRDILFLFWVIEI